MPTDPTSLTTEERTLAERLARVGAQAEPSSAVDARVLAAARDALTATAPHRRPRWPTALGLAASLLLAVGVAWRLRPLPEAPSPTTAASARLQARVPAAQVESAADTVPVQPPVPGVGLPAEPAIATDAAASNERSRPETTAMAPAARAKRVEKADAQGEPPSAVDAAPAMQAAPAAAAADASAPQAFGDAAPPPAPAAPPTATTAAPERAPPGVAGNEAARAANARGDEPELDVPPATADAPAVRDAWLQRIQALVDAGDIDGARASLRAFVARYPAYTLPENLRALAR